MSSQTLLAVACLLSIYQSPNVLAQQSCENAYSFCESLQQQGACTSSLNQAFMEAYCREACGLCEDSCVDSDQFCAPWAQSGFCTHPSFGSYMESVCPLSCGFCSNTNNPCQPNPCQNNGQCTASGSNPFCACPFGFGGSLCEQGPCELRPCQNGGTCLANGGSRTCSCTADYTGESCETLSANCADVAPLSTCTFYSDGGYCSISAYRSYFESYCPKTCGFCGDTGACQASPCLNGGTCSVTSNIVTCRCVSGFTGNNCALSPCQPNPCQNNGVCNIVGTSFTCSCTSGFTGTTCADGPCQPDPCQNNGQCTVSGSSFQCSCPSGFSGSTCQSGPCQPNPCQNSGVCNVNGNTAECVCATGFTGSTCQQIVQDVCNPNPCQNNGVCQVIGNSAQCDCTAGFSGPTCESSPCQPNPCQNNGQCTVSGSSFQCSCPSGFSGSTCLSVSGCGNRGRVDTRIIGGKPATDYWPWQVLVTSNALLCGGVIIHPSWVLTAGHCVYNSATQGVYPASYFSIKYGTLSRFGGLSVGVQQIIIHERYNNQDLLNDIALMELQSPIVFDDNVSSVCAASADLPADTAVTVTGFGYLESGALADTLYEVTLPVVDAASCTATYASLRYNSLYQMCAGTTGKDSCGGDSGGPLVHYSVDRWLLYGIVSYGPDPCAIAGQPGVYTKIASYTTWINSYCFCDFI